MAHDQMIRERKAAEEVQHEMLQLTNQFKTDIMQVFKIN